MKSLLLSTALVSGCTAHVDGEVPLSAEGQEKMQQIAEQEPVATAMVQEMLQHITAPVMNDRGQSATIDELSVSIDNTASWFQEEFAAGNIFQVGDASFATPDTIAQYDAEGGGTENDDRVVMSNDPESWTLGDVLHEFGHLNFLHGLTVTEEIRDAGAEFNASFATIIQKHRDYAYMLTALYAMPGDILASNAEKIKEARIKAEVAIATVGLHKATQDLRDDLAMPSKEETEASLRQTYASQEDMFKEFGLSMDQIIQAYFDSGMHEEILLERDEAVREFQQEFRHEMTRELHPERKIQ